MSYFYQEVEFALGPFTLSEPRNQAARFGFPFLIDSYTLMMKRPELQPDILGFIKPFTSQVNIISIWRPTGQNTITAFLF